MNAEHEDFYKRLRRRIRQWEKTQTGRESRWMEYVMAAPDLFHLLCRLSLDKEVPAEHKAKLALAIVYFISPIDLIPDFIPVGGMLDDVALAAYVLNGLLNDVEPEVLYRHWAGDGDVLGLIQRILEAADRMIGKGLWHRVRGMVGGRGGGHGRGRGGGGR
jgi:uncharacterized membrane protein YkvA (DUF1232 family)